MMSSVEWTWSTGRSNRTKNSLLRLPITAFAAGDESIMTQSSAAHPSTGALSTAMDDRATIAKRLDIMTVYLFQPRPRVLSRAGWAMATSNTLRSHHPHTSRVSK
jgi:hypothetical protein